MRTGGHTDKFNLSKPLNVSRLAWDFASGVYGRTHGHLADYTERERRMRYFETFMSVTRRHFPGIQAKQVNFIYVERGVFDREVVRLRNELENGGLADREVFLSRLHDMGVVLNNDLPVEGEG